jgi:hypothetical protein
MTAKGMPRLYGPFVILDEALRVHSEVVGRLRGAKGASTNISAHLHCIDLCNGWLLANDMSAGA